MGAGYGGGERLCVPSDGIGGGGKVTWHLQGLDGKGKQEAIQKINDVSGLWRRHCIPIKCYCSELI